MFSSLIVQKDKTNIAKEVLGTNFCKQNNIDYIGIKEDHLGVKKLHFNKRGNSVFAQNLLRYFRSKYW